MSLAIFDLDNTLIADDSDYLWGQFLVDQGIVDKNHYEQSNLKFYQDYKQDRLDINEFLDFSLQPLADNSAEQLYRWREQFITEVIKPIMLPAAKQLIDRHRAKGDTLLVITATNKFVIEPIVNLYGIENIIATEPEFSDGKFTGKFVGTPCFQQGKVALLDAWLATKDENLSGSWFYSDSHNDLPLLKIVDHPVAVDPSQKLQDFAQGADWAIISLRAAAELTK